MKSVLPEYKFDAQDLKTDVMNVDQNENESIISYHQKNDMLPES